MKPASFIISPARNPTPSPCSRRRPCPIHRNRPPTWRKSGRFFTPPPATTSPPPIRKRIFPLFNFTPAIGAFFQSNNLPKTALFFNRVQADAAAITDNAKDFYKRPRPYVTDPSLINGKLEKSFSYPSGHSTESMVLALVLADLFPDQHDAIIAEARSIGWHRVEIARHYPTDIYAGRVLAQAIVKQMNQNEDFQKDLAAAKAEVSAAMQAAKN